MKCSVKFESINLVLFSSNQTFLVKNFVLELSYKFVEFEYGLGKNLKSQKTFYNYL